MPMLPHLHIQQEYSQVQQINSQAKLDTSLDALTQLKEAIIETSNTIQ